MTDMPEDPHAGVTYTLTMTDSGGEQTTLKITAAQALDLAAGKAIAAPVVGD